MSDLSKFQEYSPGPMSVEELGAIIAAEEEEVQNFCEFEQICQELQGLGPEYVCGWICTNVDWCKRRRGFLEEVGV